MKDFGNDDCRSVRFNLTTPNAVEERFTVVRELAEMIDEDIGVDETARVGWQELNIHKTPHLRRTE